MVKNVTGGSRTKGQARKFMGRPSANKLRTSECDEELYAKVTSIFGNGMCEVFCVDGSTRLCHIRGKFKGRGKRDNFIARDTIILAGKREWESDEIKYVNGKKKLPNCDLLEVYKDNDVDRLKNTEKKIYNLFVEEPQASSNKNGDEVEFTNIIEKEEDEEYEEMISEFDKNKSTTLLINDEVIDVDDI